MTDEQLEQIKEYEWDKFCRRYPTLTGQSIIAKCFLLFKRDNTQRLLWENGFLQGCLAFKKQ